MALGQTRSVAVIGAGVSGLTCSQALQNGGFGVTVFEKSRGTGGRMATRRIENGRQFDHGAQYFTVRDDRFRDLVDCWLTDGIVQRWQGRVVSLRDGECEFEKTPIDRYVAAHGMSTICKWLARDVDVRLNTRVAPPLRRDGRWHLMSDDGQRLGQFDIVIVSTPAPQAAALLHGAPGLFDQASSVRVDGCWAVMAEFSERLATDFDGAFVHASPLSWIARDSSKPGRDASRETWVMHASASWTETHLEDDAEDVRLTLLAAFEQATGLRDVSPVYSAVHRWRFALPANPLPEPCLFDAERGIGACGDWCGGPRVEGATLSGMAVAKEVVEFYSGSPTREGLK